MANNFTDQVYKKARDVFDNQKYDVSWDTFLKDTVKPRSLLASDGPNSVHAEGLDKLAKEDEVYSSGDKDLMCDALRIALACSQKTEMLLGSAEADTMTVVKRWFGDSGSDTANKATM